MCNIDAHCILGREGRGPQAHTERILCLIFLCPALKYKFDFITVQKLFSWMLFHLFIFAFVTLAQGDIIKNIYIYC